MIAARSKLVRRVLRKPVDVRELAEMIGKVMSDE